MKIMIDLVGDGEAVVEWDDVADAKRLEAERVQKQAAYLEWLQRSPQPQVVPVSNDR